MHRRVTRARDHAAIVRIFPLPGGNPNAAVAWIVAAVRQDGGNKGVVKEKVSRVVRRAPAVPWINPLPLRTPGTACQAWPQEATQ